VEMTVRGKGGKPKTGFPPFPPPLEIAAAIPTFPPLRLLLLYKEANNLARPKPPRLRINNLEVGRIKLPKWAEYSCQTHALSRDPLTESQNVLPASSLHSALVLAVKDALRHADAGP